MNTLNWIDPADLPKTESGFSKLYRDYVTDFHKVQRYFEADFRSLPSLGEYAERLSKRFLHRQILTDVLLEQNQAYGAPQSTIENIKLLSGDKTFAVVTGQQVGMFTGPLYTIYKTITAIKLAQQLNSGLTDYRFVPVFWLEGEDHDLEEVSKVGILNSENAPVQIEYLHSGKPQTKNLGPVGDIIFDNNLEHFFGELHKSLGNSEFKQSILDFLKTCYKPGVNFNHAFASLMNKLFADDGLILISSNDRRLKQLLTPVFQKELHEFPRVSQLIIEKSAELEEQYHAQIKTKALNLFYLHKSGRYFIEPRENDFSLKGTRHFIPKDEMLRSAIETPELLSPNVALRPICQDTILPTLVYVAGPSEIAYFAQLKKVYQYFNLTMPMIYPRASVTIVENKFEHILDKYQLELSDIFQNRDKVNAKVIDLISEVKIDEMFDESNKKVEDLIAEMKFGLNYIDSTLLGTLETTKDKIDQHLQILKAKVSGAQLRKHDIALRQVDKVVNNIFPNHNFQERELCIVNFMNKHGLDFINQLKNEITIDQFKHQIIRI